MCYNFKEWFPILEKRVYNLKNITYITMQKPQTISIKISNSSQNPLPAYATTGSAGMDLRAWIENPVVIAPGERKLIPTGLRIALPEGYEMQLRPRSGLALKHGITLLNTPGTIDADYRGEIGVILINLSNEPFEIQSGDRICQAVVAPVTVGEWIPVPSVDATERGDGGFGHSGIK